MPTSALAMLCRRALCWPSTPWWTPRTACLLARAFRWCSHGQKTMPAATTMRSGGMEVRGGRDSAMHGWIYRLAVCLVHGMMFFASKLLPWHARVPLLQMLASWHLQRQRRQLWQLAASLKRRWALTRRLLVHLAPVTPGWTATRRGRWPACWAHRLQPALTLTARRAISCG